MIVLFMGGNRNGNVSPRSVWGPPGFQRLNVSVQTESLVLVARAGRFIPNGNDDPSHRGATLLALLIAGAGAVDVMLEGRGHQ
jgi:hypothetical protein